MIGSIVVLAIALLLVVAPVWILDLVEKNKK